MAATDYLSIKQVIAQYPFSNGSFRRYLIERKTNGLAKAVLQQNRKIIIYRPAFEKWIHTYFKGK